MIIHIIVAEIASELETDTVLALGVTVVVLWKAQKERELLLVIFTKYHSIKSINIICNSNSC